MAPPLLWALLGAALLLWAAQPGLALRDVRVSVPKHVLRGHSARLLCLYQLDQDGLYSVKWYKGRHEFYRFTPNEPPYKKAFPPLGDHVDLKLSSGTHVTLTDADDALSGTYSCEVSADAPSFLTFLVSDHMEVVDAPRQRPHLSGLRARYRPGDLLNVSCMAGASRPPATLTFMVNDVQQGEGSVSHHAPLQEGFAGLSRARMWLQLPVTPALGPRVRVRCIASIGSVYWQSAEKSAAVVLPSHRPEAPADDDDDRWPQFTPDEEEQLEAPPDSAEDRHAVAPATPPPTDLRKREKADSSSRGCCSASLTSLLFVLLAAVLR